MECAFVCISSWETSMVQSLVLDTRISFFCGIYSICGTVDLVVSENFKNWEKTVILSILTGVSTIQPSVGKQFQKSV